MNPTVKSKRPKTTSNCNNKEKIEVTTHETGQTGFAGRRVENTGRSRRPLLVLLSAPDYPEYHVLQLLLGGWVSQTFNSARNSPGHQGFWEISRSVATPSANPRLTTPTNILLIAEDQEWHCFLDGHAPKGGLRTPMPKYNDWKISVC